jgi:beta-1,2-mannosidase
MIRLLSLLLFLISFPSLAQEKPWMLGPFERAENAKPIIAPTDQTVWQDPMSGKAVKWESMATFNPAAIVKDGKIHVLYRAEEKLGELEIGGHTSRLGLAVSEDGANYTRMKEPVFFPTEGQPKRI